MVDLYLLRSLAEKEFRDVVESTDLIRDKLRVLLVDGSYIDFWWSSEIPDRFAHHWERRHIDGTIYRHDNMPHKAWRKVATFPQHFHNGSKENVIESHLSTHPEGSVREFIQFARTKID